MAGSSKYRKEYSFPNGRVLVELFWIEFDWFKVQVVVGPNSGPPHFFAFGKSPYATCRRLADALSYGLSKLQVSDNQPGDSQAQADLWQAIHDYIL